MVAIALPDEPTPAGAERLEVPNAASLPAAVHALIAQHFPDAP
jgi:hypothetical protein